MFRKRTSSGTPTPTVPVDHSPAPSMQAWRVNEPVVDVLTEWVLEFDRGEAKARGLEIRGERDILWARAVREARAACLTARTCGGGGSLADGEDPKLLPRRRPAARPG